MALQFTLATLEAAIQEYTLEGNALENPQFASFLPTIIQIAEERIIRDLNSNIFDIEQTGTLTANDPTLAIPAYYLGIRYLMISTDGLHYIPMIRKDVTWLENYWRSRNATAEPIYYAILGNNGTGPSAGSFILAPTPGAAYSYRLRYIQRPTSIVDVTPGTYTWLSQHAADCLLFACCAEAMGYLREDLASEQGLTARFEAKYAAELQKLRQELSNQIITGFYF